jgi:hypothetical protein
VSKFTSKKRIQQLDIALEGIKPVEIEFDGDDVSANGGALLVAQAEKLTGLLKGAAERIHDHRTKSFIDHSIFEQVAQRVAQIVSGSASTADSNYLRHDPAIKLAAGRNPKTGGALASQPTVSRFENSRTWKELYALCAWLVDYYIQCHPKPPKRLVLDFDGSAIETSGLQLQAFYRSGPYQQFMYFPLFVFDQDGWLLVAALRPGDHGEVALSLPVLKRLVKRFRQAWRGVEIVVRADGAFTDSAFYQWMDDNDVKYVLGMKHNNVLLTKTRPARTAARKKFFRKFGYPLFEGKQGEKLKLETIKFIRSLPNHSERQNAQRVMNSRLARVCADVAYRAGSWDRTRRVIARVDFSDEGLHVRYVVTNITKLAPNQIYEDIYCKRARIELWIKNIKETECKRLSCYQFKANFFRLLMHAFAYLLIYQVRMRLPEGLRRINVTQFRERFIKVPCHVVEYRNSVNIRIAASYRDAHEFRLAAKRLRSPAA